MDREVELRRRRQFHKKGPRAVRRLAATFRERTPSNLGSMAKVTQVNPHVNSAAKRTAVVRKFVRESSAIEGIRVNLARDPKTGRFTKCPK